MGLKRRITVMEDTAGGVAIYGNGVWPLVRIAAPDRGNTPATQSPQDYNRLVAAFVVGDLEDKAAQLAEEYAVRVELGVAPRVFEVANDFEQLPVLPLRLRTAAYEG